MIWPFDKKPKTFLCKRCRTFLQMKACTVIELSQWDLILLDSVLWKSKNTFSIHISFQIIKSLMIWPFDKEPKTFLCKRCRTFSANEKLHCHWVGSMRPHSPWVSFMKKQKYIQYTYFLSNNQIHNLTFDRKLRTFLCNKMSYILRKWKLALSLSWINETSFSLI